MHSSDSVGQTDRQHFLREENISCSLLPLKRLLPDVNKFKRKKKYFDLSLFHSSFFFKHNLHTTHRL